MGKFFKQTFHRARCAREAEQRAADLRNQAASNARQEEAIAAARKKEALDAIDKACAQGREKIEAWYGSELKQAEENREKNQADYQNTLAELSQAVNQAKSDIDVGFEEQRARLLESQAEDTKKLEECRIKIIDRVTDTKAHYSHNTKNLDSLWQEVQSTLLHERCQEAYLALKGPLDKTQKTKNYSVLIAYTRHLSQENHLTNADFERYTGFFKTLYSAGPTLSKDDNFYHIDKEINQLFSEVALKDNYSVKNAYDSERSHFKKTYKASQEFHIDLSEKLETTKRDIAVQYDKAHESLVEEKEQKLKAIQENYVKIQLDIETEIESYEQKYEDYILALIKDKDRYCSELEDNEQEAKKQVGDQYAAEVAAIQDATRKIMDEINTALSQELEQLKKAKKSAIANVGIAIAAGAGAYFSGGLLAGFSSTIIATVESSLGATALGAVANLASGRDSVGFKVNINLGAQGPLQNPDSFRFDGDSHRKKHMNDLHTNLESIRDKFSDFSKDIEKWQSEAEDHLFYSLNRPVSLPTADFSESMTVFFNQKPADIFSVQLGALNHDGLRTVDWGTGRSIMLDQDLRWMFRTMMGVDDPFFNQDWHQSQVFSFDQRAIQTIKNRVEQESHLISLQGDSLQAVRKRSHLEGLLNYLIPAAEAQEFNYSSPLRDSEGAESNRLTNHSKVGAGFLVGLGQKALSIATDMVVGCTEFLQHSEAIIDDPQLIDAELLDRRAAQGQAISFALQHPVETGQAILSSYKNDINQGVSASRVAYRQGEYFESGRAIGESLAEPGMTIAALAMPLAGSVRLANIAVKTVNQGAKSGSKAVRQFVKTHEFRSPILFQYENASFNMGLPLDRMELQHPVRKIINEAQKGDGFPRVKSIPDSMRMRAELAFQEAGILDRNGRLTEFALENAENIFRGKTLNNPLVIEKLTKNGESISDWSKYRTLGVSLENGQRKEIHFYYNTSTGQINYEIDFKIKDILKTYSSPSLR